MKIDNNRLFCLNGKWITWGDMTTEQKQFKKESKIKIFEASGKPWFNEDEDFWRSVEI